jgi:hypothetical protein
MQNGEDVIADLFETRDPDTNTPFAYRLNDPYCIVIMQAPQEILIESQEVIGNENDDNSIDLQFHPYTPLSKHNYVFVPIGSVTLIYEPHDGLLEKYNQLLENAKTFNPQKLS